MPALRFTTTHLSGLRAAGRTVELQHAVIAPILHRELGPRYGRFFADFEPEGSDLRAWYVEADALPRRVSDLSPAQGDAIRATAAAMVGDIRALAERIAGESAQKANLARILVSATTFPDEDIWCDGDQPIVVNWGFGREDRPERVPRAITGLTSRPEVHPATSGGAPVLTRLLGFPSGRLAPLLWLFFVVLVALIYRTLLPACGIDERWQPLAHWNALDACERPSVTADAAEEGAQLSALVRQAELQVAEQRQICTAPPVPANPPVTPLLPTHVDQEVEQRLPAAAPRGEVEISLLWDSHADLDLIIDCPGGETLSQASYGLQACGGRLLADVNKAGGPILDRPIEHAAWDQPPPGNYTVKVELYDYNDLPPGTDVPFTIHIRRGADDKLIQGHITGARAVVTGTTIAF